MGITSNNLRSKSDADTGPASGDAATRQRAKRVPARVALVRVLTGGAEDDTLTDGIALAIAELDMLRPHLDGEGYGEQARAALTGIQERLRALGEVCRRG